MKNKKLVVIFALAILLLLIPLLMSKSISADSYYIHYIPLSVHFYGNLKPNQVEKSSLYEFEMKSRRIDNLFSGKYGIEEVGGDIFGDFRIKIIRQKDGKALFITKDKKLLSEGGWVLVESVTLDKVIKHIEEKSKDAECKDPDKFIC